MSAMNLLLALAAAIMVGIIVSQNVEAGWPGPLAGALVGGLLIAFELKRKGRRNAR